MVELPTVHPENPDRIGTGAMGADDGLHEGNVEVGVGAEAEVKEDGNEIGHLSEDSKAMMRAKAIAAQIEGAEVLVALAGVVIFNVPVHSRLSYVFSVR